MNASGDTVAKPPSLSEGYEFISDIPDQHAAGTAGTLMVAITSRICS